MDGRAGRWTWRQGRRRVSKLIMLRNKTRTPNAPFHALVIVVRLCSGLYNWKSGALRGGSLGVSATATNEVPWLREPYCSCDQLKSSNTFALFFGWWTYHALEYRHFLCLPSDVIAVLKRHFNKCVRVLSTSVICNVQQPFGLVNSGKYTVYSELLENAALLFLNKKQGINEPLGQTPTDRVSITNGSIRRRKYASRLLLCVALEVNPVLPQKAR